METLLGSISELEKNLLHVVKATVESTLGQLGTVGAMAIDDFIARVNAVVCDLASASGQYEAVPVGSTITVQAPVITSSIFRGEGSVSGSTVPSAFGDALSVMTSSVPQSTAVKPGKNLIRSHDGF